MIISGHTRARVCSCSFISVCRDPEASPLKPVGASGSLRQMNQGQYRLDPGVNVRYLLLLTGSHKVWGRGVEPLGFFRLRRKENSLGPHKIH